MADDYRRFGRLCFGSLTISPLQRCKTPDEGGALIAYAYARGVSFVDTAELYETYPHVREAKRRCPGLRIATKCYAYDQVTAEASFRKAVREMGTDHIDVFLLHEQESRHTLRGHEQALSYLQARKRAGDIGLVGLSTHYVAGVRAAAQGGLDVVHPLLNMAGLGIADGTREQMQDAVREAHGRGLFVYSMKPLGGGHLITRRQEAMAYLWSLPYVHCVAVGMQCEAEVDWHIAALSGETPSQELERAVVAQPRRLLIHDWCEGCGACVARCRNRALSIRGNKAAVDEARCALCGYCAGACPQFCIKVV